MMAWRTCEARVLLHGLVCAALTIAHSCYAMAAAAPVDFSEQLDSLWNFSNPAQSEQRFREELQRHPARSREALETTTQIARTQSLRRQFREADATLDTITPFVADAPARVRVRYLLERGRTLNSAGKAAQAVPLFTEATQIADKSPAAEFYHVDALHMLGIAAPEAEQLDWNRRALAIAEVSADVRTRQRWSASLNHNIGWTYFNRRDPATALAYWQKALALRETMDDAQALHVARWTIARGYREVGRFDEAETIQRSLAAQTERTNTPDGYVYEELAEIAVARGDRPAARMFAAKAYALLRNERSVLATDDAAHRARLARLAILGGGDAPR